MPRRRQGPARSHFAQVDRRPATLAEARALAHPLRLRILRLCLDEALSNKQLATALAMNPATVLHHVRVLAKSGFLSEEPLRPGSRGSVEKPYRATGKSWQMDLTGTPERSAVHRTILEAVAAEMDEGGPEAVIELDRLAMRLTPDQLEKLARRLEHLVEQCSQIDEPGGEPVAMLLLLHRRPAVST